MRHWRERLDAARDAVFASNRRLMRGTDSVPDMLRAIELTTLAFDAAPERLRPSIRRLYLEMLEVMFRRKQAAVRAGIRKQSNQTAGTRRRGPTAVAD